MARGTVRVLLVVILVVLAGCGGSVERSDRETPTESTRPTPVTRSPTPDTTPSGPPPEVEVENGELPINATEVWHRVHELRGQDPPDNWAPTVIVKPAPERVRDLTVVRFGAASRRSPDHFVTFGKRLGIGRMKRGETASDEVGGHANSLSVTLLVGEDAPAGRIETTLAHEFEHLLQPGGWSASEVPEWALSEGGAAYVARAYAEQYLDDPERSWQVRRSYMNATDGGSKYFFSLYYFGYRHFQQRIDSPANISRVYENPPDTYEQLVHGYAPESHRPKPLDVRAPGSLRSAPVGELFLRVSLATELNESTAARAAAGWGNDTVVPFEGGNFVWVVRMDDERNATELEAAFETYLDAKGNSTGESWRTDEATYRLVRISDETLGLVVGSGEFVRNASVAGTDGTVTVST